MVNEIPIVVFESLCTIQASIRTIVCMIFVKNRDRIVIVWFTTSDEVDSDNGGSSDP